MQTTLDKIWLEEFQGEKALRADFSNDRHHRVVIQRPHGNEQLAQALIELALNVRQDPHLTPNAELCGGPSGPSERAPGSAAGGSEKG